MRAIRRAIRAPAIDQKSTGKTIESIFISSLVNEALLTRHFAASIPKSAKPENFFMPRFYNVGGPQSRLHVSAIASGPHRRNIGKIEKLAARTNIAEIGLIL
jgi:hypothetical protein